jgi:hypothetical protein
MKLNSNKEEYIIILGTKKSFFIIPSPISKNFTLPLFVKAL